MIGRWSLQDAAQTVLREAGAAAPTAPAATRVAARLVVGTANIAALLRIGIGDKRARIHGIALPALARDGCRTRRGRWGERFERAATDGLDRNPE